MMGNCAVDATVKKYYAKRDQQMSSQITLRELWLPDAYGSHHDSPREVPGISRRSKAINNVEFWMLFLASSWLNGMGWDDNMNYIMRSHLNDMTGIL